MEKINDFPELWAKLISRPLSGGKGAIVKAELEYAEGEYSKFQNRDLEYDPREYNQILATVLTGLLA